MKQLEDYVKDLVDQIDPEAEGRKLAIEAAKGVQMALLRDAVGEGIGDSIAIELETIQDVQFAGSLSARKVILDAVGRWSTEIFNRASALLIPE